MKKYTFALFAIILIASSAPLVLLAIEVQEQPRDRTTLRFERGGGRMPPNINRRAEVAQVIMSHESTKQAQPSEPSIAKTQIPQQLAPTTTEEHSEEVGILPEPVANEVIEEPAVETITKEPVEVMPEIPIPVFNEIPDDITEEPKEYSTQSVTYPELDRYLEEVLLEIHRLTNIEREDEELPLLEFDPGLAKVATRHSQDMAILDYFSHISPKGCDTGCRLRNADYVAIAWGENIGWITTFDETSAEELAEQFVDSWMDSEGHRHNILSNKFTHEGVGIAQLNDKIYVTTNFADPW